MTERPLLFFPSKDIVSRSKLSGGGSKYHTPSSDRQGQRLSPSFQQLFNNLDAQRIAIQQSMTGIDPEQALVFETIGSVEDFSNAVSKIDGFEWLGEIEEEITPDDDFFPVNDAGELDEGKSLTGRIYLIFTNVSAMSELLSLWNLWLSNPNFNCQSGEYRGKGKFKEVFKLLKNIRKWGIEERFEETNLISYWNESLQIMPDRIIRFEIELWYRKNTEKRNNSFQTVQNLLMNAGGRVVRRCDIPEIAYHAILAELPANEIRNIIDNRDTELIKCEGIMYFKPSGQITMADYDVSEGTQETIAHDSLLPEGDPVIAIFDGYPLANHEVLSNRITVDDPDNFEQEYQVEDRQHGTAMCSLIVKGDLGNSQSYIRSPLYVRPIMKPNEFNRKEFVPDNILLVDTIHRAVKRMFDGENGELPVASNVKIINLSIGDTDRVFYSSVSPLGRILDWLSYKYNILFVISSGNNANQVNLGISKQEFASLPQIEKEKLFVKTILGNRRNNRLISPAESINNLTVGAIHNDSSSINSNDIRLNPYSVPFPSTYTAIGGGHRRAIKPDLVYDGGRQMYEYSMTNEAELKPTLYKRSPGILVAAPDSSLCKTRYEIGTSNSCALMTRNGYFCYETLKELSEINDIESNYLSVLIKALLIHGCSWDNIGNYIEERLELGLDRQSIKKIKSKWIGYGYPDITKALECTNQRATVIGFSSLVAENAHIYTLPLPPSLASRTIKRRLTISLAWMSPIASSTQKYRVSKLWFEAKNPITTKRINSDDKAVKRGTLQHEIFEGDSAQAFIDGDSISIKVNCTKDAADFTDDIKYALVVSLEVAEGVDMPIYQEIKDRIAIPITVNQMI